MDWARSSGLVIRAGVECTGSYGAALGRFLRSNELTVIEVNQPDKATRRRRGKTDTIDAEAAAHAVLSGPVEPPRRPSSLTVPLKLSGSSRWPRSARSKPAPRPSTSSGRYS
ncbi:transposase [Streptomyces sp. NPDC059680]|uniref:IS110 family transposase n=1 Tax=Streptomyces sp. NPDC059680 TaxID=3346904 RepID=UPI0036BFDE08